ncbi:GGDEF domain-containing protein [Aestuariispira insulae]|uniref:diguanylate cyclase n=1 Tax=Aestuariispira insulae TaxID=1461337 RepID=A0A3D9HWN6_9PROT|nr:GGDEF domain-containing protein [Aestuariispira insulae]RED53918.1 diguanylate cyclase (GGDEF)-like protein [Aestuariispira insulae]
MQEGAVLQFPIAAVRTNAEGTVDAINQSGESFFSELEIPIRPGVNLKSTLAGLDDRAWFLDDEGCCPVQRLFKETPGSILLRFCSGRWVEVRNTPSSAGQGSVFVFQDASQNMLRDRALANLCRADISDPDFYDLAAKALADGLGYRWAWVTRFLPQGNHCQVIGAHDGDQMIGQVYAVRHTPCELVVQNREFTFISTRLAEFYAKDKPLVDMGGEAYVGQMYFGADGEPLGHVFAINDHPDFDRLTAQEVAYHVSRQVSWALEYRRLKRDLSHQKRVARQDGLTNALNRSAFDHDVRRIADQVRDGRMPDCLMAYIDIDGLKNVNDSRGHIAGDELLCLFAQSLIEEMRGDDRVYRIGGDEFAVLWPGTPGMNAAQLANRVATAAKILPGAGFPDAGASFGISAISEADGDPDQFIRIADQRMYEEKEDNRQKRSSPPEA